MALPSANNNGYANNVDVAAKTFAEYGDFIDAIIRCKVKNEAQADDLYQDFFLSLVSKPLPAGVQNVKSYLYRAITNDIIDAARRAEKRQIRLHKYAGRLGYSINEKRPENAFIKIEQTKKFFELIKRQLPNSEARAVTLRYKNNYNIKEVADKMNVNKKSVIRYVCVGLKKIRQFLTEEYDN